MSEKGAGVSEELKHATQSTVNAEPQNVERIDFHKLRDVDELVAGTVIEGMTNASELDKSIASLLELYARGFVYSARNVLYGNFLFYPPRSEGSLAELEKRVDFAEMQKQSAHRQRFYGELHGAEIMILPPDDSFISKTEKTGRGYAEAIGQPLTFLTAREMYSTGRGRVGELKTETSVFAVKWPSNDVSLHMKLRPVNTKKTQNDITRLIQESQMSHDEAYRYSLSRVTSGGLPSLGKRS